jgi:hypothetical protein
MALIHKFEEMTPDKRPQHPYMDGTGLRFETMEHGGEYPDTMPLVTSGLPPISGPSQSLLALRIRAKTRAKRFRKILGCSKVQLLILA